MSTFTSFNGYAVEDETARQSIDTLNNNVSSLSAALNVERERINSLSSLEEGSTTGDAELIDGRTGADGTVYSNLGTAIRTQIKENYDDVLNISEDGYLHFHKNLFVNGIYNESTGVIGSTSSNYPYRVILANKFTCDRDITIIADEGFRAYIYYFVNDVLSETVISRSNVETTIPEGSIINLAIARNDQNTSEVADVNEFVSAIKIKTYFNGLMPFSVLVEHPYSNYTTMTPQNYLIEMYLDGIDTNRTPIISQLAHNFQNSAGLYMTALYIAYEDSPNDVICRFTEYTEEPTEKYNFKVLRLPEFSSSGVSGYAIVDFSEIPTGRTFPNTPLNIKKISEINANPRILAETDIVQLNKEKENLVVQASRTVSSNINSSAKTPLEFIHFSDIHAHKDLWKRIVKYMDNYRKYLSFAIHTGDFCGDDHTDYVNLYDVAYPDEAHIFNVLGNHDVYANAGDTQLASQSATNGMMFPSTTKNSWGAVFGEDEDNAMYWYKDFPSSNIRIIGIDQYYWTGTQSTWLDSVLNSAKTLGYGVITVSHTPSSALTSVDSSFWSLDSWQLSNNGEATLTPRVFEENIVNFKESGGNHICHLCGHFHHDKVGITASGILTIMVECASNDNRWTDTIREVGTKSYDCFNVISVDEERGVIKIIRIGCNSDGYLQSKNTLCYDYINKNIIANS